MKKYSLVGTLLNGDRKYLLKEFLIISAYSNACLGINRFVLWPICFGLLTLATYSLLVELALAKIEACTSARIASEAKNNNSNSVKNQG